jgi:hypothetical protein
MKRKSQEFIYEGGNLVNASSHWSVGVLRWPFRGREGVFMTHRGRFASVFRFWSLTHYLCYLSFLSLLMETYAKCYTQLQFFKKRDCTQ